MSTLTLKTSSVDDFFARSKADAHKADTGEKIPQQRIMSFEDPVDLLRFVTDTRVALIREVKSSPGSITDIAIRLHRDRSAVKRDIDDLAAVGIFIVEEVVSPGHGRKKKVRIAADSFRLEAIVA